MSVSKKHFESIAESVRTVRGAYPGDEAQAAITSLVVYLCHDFARWNPNFDAERFRKACEVQP